MTSGYSQPAMPMEEGRFELERGATPHAKADSVLTEGTGAWKDSCSGWGRRSGSWVRELVMREQKAGNGVRLGRASASFLLEFSVPRA